MRTVGRARLLAFIALAGATVDAGAVEPPELIRRSAAQVPARHDAGVWTSCAMILPLRDNGAASSPIRPVAIGAPAR